MSPRTDRGAVTVEAAFASLALVSLLSVLVSAIGVVLVGVQCVDVAGAVARQAARGDAAGVAEARSHAPAGAQVVITSTATSVTVRVNVAATLVPGSSLRVPLSATATSILETGVGS